jgi:hypothetical protein
MPGATSKPHPGSQALLDKFPSEAERSAYFRDLAASSHRRRLVVTDEQAAVLAECYGVLGDILRRHRAKQAAPIGPDPSPDPTDQAA